MREETLTRYIADDGTPFVENKLACQQYEMLCNKYKDWLRTGKVMFWSHCGEYLNFDLCEYTFTDRVCYLDWLKKQLSTGIGYLIIHTQPGEDTWDSIWEFVVKYCVIDSDTVRKIEASYKKGDMLNYDANDCRFHDIDFVVRNAAEMKEKIMNSVTEDFVNRYMNKEEA